MLEMDPQIDAAVESYPLAPVPDGFTRRVMAAVRRLPTSPPRIVYRLDFLDVVLPAFFAFFGMLALALPLGALALLDESARLELRSTLHALLQRLPDLSISLLGGLVLVGVLGTAAALLTAALWLMPSRVELGRG